MWAPCVETRARVISRRSRLSSQRWCRSGRRGTCRRWHRGPTHHPEGAIPRGGANGQELGGQVNKHVECCDESHVDVDQRAESRLHVLEKGDAKGQGTAEVWRIAQLKMRQTLPVCGGYAVVESVGGWFTVGGMRWMVASAARGSHAAKTITFGRPSTRAFKQQPPSGAQRHMRSRYPCSGRSEALCPRGIGRLNTGRLAPP